VTCVTFPARFALIKAFALKRKPPEVDIEYAREGRGGGAQGAAMKRVLMGVVAGTMVVSGVFATSVALAGPSNQASVTLSCDKNVSATVVLSMTSSTGADAGAVPNISCGPGASHNRVVVDAPAAADWVTVTTFDVSSTTGNASCLQDEPYAVPARIDCPSDGRSGARLVVR
jgi:hypothetical protein